MHDFENLEKRLLDLTPGDYSDLIRKVDAERRRESDAESAYPDPGASRDEFARWIARQHLAVDKGISRIFHLPSGAPPNEVRLLEINDLAAIPENAPIEAVDFMPDIAGFNYSLFVADVTPRQFEAISGNTLPLPRGWRLDDMQEIDRRR